MAKIKNTMTVSLEEFGKKAGKYALDEFEYKGLTIRQWADKITSGKYHDEDISAKDVCKEIAKLFGSPCDYSPMDEIMLKNEECEKVCGKQTDEECWYRFFVYKLKGGDL